LAYGHGDRQLRFAGRAKGQLTLIEIPHQRRYLGEQFARQRAVLPGWLRRHFTKCNGFGSVRQFPNMTAPSVSETAPALTLGL
jgi:hypothetical protein